MEQRLVAVTQGTPSANRAHEALQDHTWFNSLPTCSPNTELSQCIPKKWGSQRNWGPAAQIPHRGSRWWLHKGKEKTPCSTTPQLQKNSHSPSRWISASPGVFHPHRDGSHRCWMPENPQHHHSSLHRQFPPCLPQSWQPACPSSSQHVQPGAAAPRQISPPSSPALLSVTLHPCVPAPAPGLCQSPGTSRIKGSLAP